MAWPNTVYPVTDSAGDLWSQYKDTDEKLWQIQVDHDARPSISVNIRRSLEEYLKDSKDGLPETIQKLQSECGIKLTMTGKDDTDNIGCFVQYRIGFYVAGDVGSLVNFFLFFDGYLAFKAKQFARANLAANYGSLLYQPHHKINVTFRFVRGWGRM